MPTHSHSQATSDLVYVPIDFPVFYKNDYKSDHIVCTHFLLASFTQHNYFDIYACHCMYYEFIPIPNHSLAALCTRPNTSHVGVRANSKAASPKVGMRLGATLGGVGGSPGAAHEHFPGWMESPPCHCSPKDWTMLRTHEEAPPTKYRGWHEHKKKQQQIYVHISAFAGSTNTHSSVVVSELCTCLHVVAALSPVGMLSQLVETPTVPT